MEQEVIEETTGERAANGDVIPGATQSAGNVIDLLEDGSFSVELYEAMKALAQRIESAAEDNGGKAKGTLTLKIDLAKEDGMFKVSSDFTTKEPKMKRPRSILWTDRNGDFTRFPPNQRQMFGVNQIGGGGKVRNV